MNLILDIGNTLVKTAIVDPQEQIRHKDTRENLSVRELEQMLKDFPAISTGILSTTRETDPAMEDFLNGRLERYIRFGPVVPTPLINLYKTPQTLGADRLAAAVGAWATAPAQELLIVDLGSAITIDRVSSRAEYLGGNISPGMSMRFEALHRFTDKLPLGEPSGDFRLTGDSTAAAIRGGVINGIVHEIDGYIERIEAENGPLNVFFTGNDANFFADKVKKPIFVVCDLVIKGLNRILLYNLHEQKQND